MTYIMPTVDWSGRKELWASIQGFLASYVENHPVRVRPQRNATVLDASARVLSIEQHRTDSVFPFLWRDFPTPHREHVAMESPEYDRVPGEVELQQSATQVVSSNGLPFASLLFASLLTSFFISSIEGSAASGASPDTCWYSPLQFFLGQLICPGDNFRG